ncbi:hypothetical protein INS49_006115 [Diaporthe citri]|uniref:uncharacterized protein n=1 Tax=Diaporthe citri TaxID=83186 RepID=UPI001C8080AC|nr:uncharacterized protein INS49_006115 [Diaporthe citri]KAG6364514.1 hypothetical protein INS49_006115 [Diaporthe citri]
MHASSTPQSSRSNLRPVSSNDNAGPHKLTPQEAALRGASLAFSKQQQQARRQSLTPSSNNPAVFSPQDGGALVAATSASRARSPTGSTTGNSSVVLDGDAGQATEQERERLALFLSSPGSEQSRGPYLLPPGGRAAGTATDPKSTSFIAATLAASRSVSPGSGPAVQGGSDERTAPGEATPRRAGAYPEEAHCQDGQPGGDQDVDPVKDSPSRPLVNRSKGWPLPDTKLDYDNEYNKDSGVESIKPRRKPVPKTKPKPSPKPKPKIKTTPRDGTPPPPVVRRANTEIVSPKPRRPDTRPKLEFEAPTPSTEETEKPNTTSPEERKRKPEPPKPKKLEKSEATDQRTADPSEPKDSVVSESRPPTLPARSSFPPVAAKPPAPKKRQTIQRLSLVPSSDGQDSSTSTSPNDKADGRPLTGDSMSSNDTFVSASSTPTRAESPPVFDPASRTLTPKALPPRSASARPVTPAFSARTPPPVPPSRRKGGARKAASRAASPHHMKKTLRDHRPKSDDEDARRPHHKKGLINSKKHTHHEGSRRRWREEITERERKRYEAVWASNRGLFLVPASSDPEHNHRAGGGGATAVRDRSHEELSEHVASVVVRDIWSRSRLPEPELAEVWDLVYGLGQEGGPRVRAALGKSEFVVGTWLIDQRLRGRKIPPRVSDSVWSSAKGLWSAARNPNHHHHRKGKGKGV